MDNKGILLAGIKCVRVLLALLTVVPSVASAVDSGYRPPTAVYVHEQFGISGGLPFDPRSWESVGGSWQAAADTYNNTVASPTALSTIFEYSFNPFAPPEPAPPGSFTLSTQVLNQGATAAQLAGVVFNYVDSTNYDEAVLSPTGTMLLRRVSGGAATTLRTINLTAGAQNIWFQLQLVVEGSVLTINVNGVTRIDHLTQTGNTSGRVGFVTHNTTAKFDYIFVGSPFGEQPFKEDFSSEPGPEWRGNWIVSGGTLNNPATEATSRSVPFGGISFQPESTLAYTLWVRMFNPYGASGNLVGVLFNDHDVEFPGDRASHGELVFSPTGVARIDLFYDGARHTIATAPYQGRARKWFDVRVDNAAGSFFVWVDGVLLFDNIDVSPPFDNIRIFPVYEGFVELLTHWSPGKFDDVWYENTQHTVLSAKFGEPLTESWNTSGTWNTSGGTLNSTAVGATDLALYNCSCWSTDSLIRARLLNQYGASGNLVGVVYNYVDAGVARDKPDYYEVVFATTGTARINKVIHGVRTLVASGSHHVPRNVWFDVAVLRRGTTTTVKVNGTTIFNNVQQGELGGGKAGVVTHWSKGRFDNVVVRDDPLR